MPDAVEMARRKANKTLTPAQAHRRAEVDARNRAIAAGHIKPPASGIYGRPKDAPKPRG